MFIYFWERERERERERVSEWGGAERETGRHRIWSRLQAPSCQHRAWCGAWTHKPWDHDLGQSWMLNRLSHPGTPRVLDFLRLSRWFCCVVRAENHDSKWFLYWIIMGNVYWGIKCSLMLWLIVSTEPDTGPELSNHETMTWAEVRRLTNWAT